jgi:predicted Rossmann fold flavoprotein
MAADRNATDPVVVVGAGAAGTVAALHAAAAGRRVVLLERTRDGGRKIMVSGGGRCNVLPSALAPERFVTESSPHTLRKILSSWPLAGQRRFFEEEVGLALALEPETGKLFPASHRARDVRDGLYRLAARRGVELRLDAEVADLVPPTSPGGSWTVAFKNGEGLAAAAVVLATGGLSMPGTGSDGAGLALARRLGHTIHPTYPALTPLTGDRPEHAALAGISRDVEIQAPGSGARLAARGGFLFTHRGYSGPAVLDLSHLAVRARLAGRPQSLLVRWTALDAAAWDAALQSGAGTVASPLRRQLPERLAALLLAEAGIEGGRPLAQLRREERRRLVERLTAWPLPWAGDEGYAKAEVTGGGVALAEVHPRTLESRHHPGLFLCGEILDAFGPIGGHNFAWAWATGRAAGHGAAASLR